MNIFTNIEEKIMKTKTLIFALTLSISVIATASSNGGCGNRHMEKLGQDLNLSVEQQQQFEAIMQDKDDKVHAAMESIHNDMKAQLSKVLSDEQMQMLESKRQRMDERRERRGPIGKRGGQRGRH